MEGLSHSQASAPSHCNKPHHHCHLLEALKLLQPQTPVPGWPVRGSRYCGFRSSQAQCPGLGSHSRLPSLPVTSTKSSRAGEMSQCVKVFALQAWHPEFYS